MFFKTISEIVRAISCVWNLRKPPSFWGLSYIASIFVFAVVYGLADARLIQTTIVSDAYTRSLVSELEGALDTSLDGVFRHGKLTHSRVQVSTNSENEVIASFELRIGKDDSVFNKYVAKVSLGPSREFLGDRHGDVKSYSSSLVELEKVSSRSIGLSDQFEAISQQLQYTMSNRFPDVAIVGHGSVIPFGYEYVTLVGDIPISLPTDEEAAETERLARTLLNELRQIDPLSNVVRIIYFSAVTATTLGYGDIVPVGPKGRIIVVIQTISSIILVGVYLNSLSISGTRNNQPTVRESREQDDAKKDDNSSG
jgi:voltage-gated potassium channel Kch